VLFRSTVIGLAAFTCVTVAYVGFPCLTVIGLAAFTCVTVIGLAAFTCLTVIGLAAFTCLTVIGLAAFTCVTVIGVAALIEYVTLPFLVVLCVAVIFFTDLPFCADSPPLCLRADNLCRCVLL
jgi:hypothetical protein